MTGVQTCALPIFEKDGPAGKESGQSKPSIFIVQVKDGKIALPAFSAKK